jgi:phenylacetate-CoA ligase
VAVWSVLAGAAQRYLGLRRSQYWDAEKLGRYQHEALKQTLKAAAQIPFYAQRFGGAPSARDLRQLPRLRRLDVRALNESVRDLYPDRAARFTCYSSSGSTGTPAEFLFDRAHQIGRYAARARYLFENGWNPARCNVWLIHHGPHLGRDDEQLVQSRAALRTTFLEASTDFDKLTDRLCELEPLHIFSYPEFLEEIIKELERSGRTFPSLKKVFTGSEVLDDPVRQHARDVLGVEIADSYGTTEGFIAWECPSGRYHGNAEHMMMEIVDDDDRQVAPGQMGRVVVTTLENHLMPLVRYEIGDYAIASNGRCGCGRTLPTIERVIGRGINLFRLRNGRLLSPWDMVEVVRRYREFRQFQLVQEELDRYVINFAAAGAIANKIKAEIRLEFARILGLEVTVSYQRVAEVPRTSSGKYMIALSKLA